MRLGYLIVVGAMHAAVLLRRCAAWLGAAELELDTRKPYERPAILRSERVDRVTRLGCHAP